VAPRDGAASPDDGACPWPPPGALLAEWRANGNTDDEVPCSPFGAEKHGHVVYGPGREGRAWQFRSQDTSRNGGPDYIQVPGSAGYVYQQVTVDAWVMQTGFNAYGGSNRYIAGTGFKDFTFAPGEWLLYVHENDQVFFLFQVGAQRPPQPRADYATCKVTDIDGPGAAPIGKWQRVTATYDGSALRCYRDGVMVDQVALAGTARVPADAIVIGRNYPGDIDAVRVFGRALTAPEIGQPWP
jgi:hypothetical protein